MLSGAAVGWGESRDGNIGKGPLLLPEGNSETGPTAEDALSTEVEGDGVRMTNLYWCTPGLRETTATQQERASSGIISMQGDQFVKSPAMLTKAIGRWTMGCCGDVVDGEDNVVSEDKCEKDGLRDAVIVA